MLSVVSKRRPFGKYEKIAGCQVWGVRRLRQSDTHQIRDFLDVGECLKESWRKIIFN